MQQELAGLVWPIVSLAEAFNHWHAGKELRVGKDTLLQVPAVGSLCLLHLIHPHPQTPPDAREPFCVHLLFKQAESQLFTYACITIPRLPWEQEQ